MSTSPISTSHFAARLLLAKHTAAILAASLAAFARGDSALRRHGFLSAFIDPKISSQEGSVTFHPPHILKLCSGAARNDKDQACQMQRMDKFDVYAQGWLSSSSPHLGSRLTVPQVNGKFEARKCDPDEFLRVSTPELDATDGNADQGFHRALYKVGCR